MTSSNVTVFTQHRKYPLPSNFGNLLGVDSRSLSTDILKKILERTDDLLEVKLYPRLEDLFDLLYEEDATNVRK